jgi:prepilin-type N-terminal cleavage/methylation domain-containing protein
VIRNKRGFTLIELMTAVAIVLLVITGSLLSFMHLMFLADSSINLTIAANDAQYVLEQLKGVPTYAAISSYVAPTLNNLSEETITLNRSVGPNLANITVNVNWREKNQARNFSLSTCIAR